MRSFWPRHGSCAVCPSPSAGKGLDVGEDTGTPVNLSYDVPFTFTGKLDKVTIDLE